MFMALTANFLNSRFDNKTSSEKKGYATRAAVNMTATRAAVNMTCVVKSTTKKISSKCHEHLHAYE